MSGFEPTVSRGDLEDRATYIRRRMLQQLRMVEGPTRELRRHATNAGIQPDPLVWVHLEGLATRDVY